MCQCSRISFSTCAGSILSQVPITNYMQYSRLRFSKMALFMLIPHSSYSVTVWLIFSCVGVCVPSLWIWVEACDCRQWSSNGSDAVWLLSSVIQRISPPSMLVLGTHHHILMKTKLSGEATCGCSGQQSQQGPQPIRQHQPPDVWMNGLQMVPNPGLWGFELRIGMMEQRQAVPIDSAWIPDS